MRFEFQVARFADMLVPLRCEDGSALWPTAWSCDLAPACARAHAPVWRRGRGAARTIGQIRRFRAGLASVPSAPPPRPHFPWRARTNQAVTIRFAKQWHYYCDGILVAKPVIMAQLQDRGVDEALGQPLRRLACCPRMQAICGQGVVPAD